MSRDMSSLVCTRKYPQTQRRSLPEQVDDAPSLNLLSTKPTTTNILRPGTPQASSVTKAEALLEGEPPRDRYSWKLLLKNRAMGPVLQEKDARGLILLILRVIL